MFNVPAALRTFQRVGCQISVACAFLALFGCATAAAPSPTARPIDAHAMVLGGTPQAFQSRLGGPTAPYLFEYRAANGRPVVLTLAAAQGTAGGLRVISVDLEPEDGVAWDDVTARAIYGQFVPSDAVHVRDVNGTHGIHHLFRSAALAATFSLVVFRDAQGKQLAPGTFDVICGAAVLTDVVSFSCDIAIGEIRL